MADNVKLETAQKFDGVANIEGHTSRRVGELYLLPEDLQLSMKATHERIGVCCYARTDESYIG